MKFALCIDWETSGSQWNDDSSKYYQGISFGAVVFSTETFEVVDAIYHEVLFKPEKYKWSKDAEKIHGISQERLSEIGISQEDAAANLAEFILKWFSSQTPVTFLGHNAGFDISFTNQLLNTIGIEFGYERKQNLDGWVVLNHVVWDTSIVGSMILGIHKSNDLFDLIGIERNEHNALEDALATIEVAKMFRKLCLGE